MNNKKTPAGRLCQAATVLSVMLGTQGAMAAGAALGAPTFGGVPDALAVTSTVSQTSVEQARPPKARKARSARTAQAALPMGTPAYQAADSAYKAYEAKDYQSAIENAEAATRLAPGNAAYWQLLASSQTAAGLLDDADRTLTRGMAATGDEGAFTTPRDNLRRSQALAAGTAMYAAQRQGNIGGATAAAREAVRLAPRHPGYRIALLNLLLQGSQWADADRAASDAMEVLPASAAPLVLRAQARQRLGRLPEAAADYDRALQLTAADPAQQRAVRLIAADAALAALEPQRAMERLQGLPDADAEAAPRRKAAALLLARPLAGQLNPGTTTAFALPGIDCSNVEKALTCALLPGAPAQPAGYASAVAAYAAMNARDYATAATRAAEAADASPANRDYQLLLMNALAANRQPREAAQAATAALALDHPDAAVYLRRSALRREAGDEPGAQTDLETALRLGTLSPAEQTGALADLGRKREARERLALARANGELKSTPALELAYLATRTGDAPAAATAFAEADAAGKLPATAFQDAAYAALRARRDDEAVAYFKRTIDADGIALKLDPQLLFNTRRAVSELTRRWGVLASLTYRNGGGAVPGFGVGAGGPAGTKTLQAGAEAYWRPFGYQGGQYVELFARAFESLYSQSGGTTGVGSLQAGIGIRYKPLADHNAVLSLSRVFARNGNDDWLAQAAYSNDWGSDLRVDVPSWWTTRLAAEVGRYIEHPQTYALASAMTGRSYRINDPDGRTVVYPHAVVSAEYNSTYATRSSVGVGPGVSLRHWFREDKYDAPRSYVDFTLQYRALVSGDNRAKGLFLSSLISY